MNKSISIVTHVRETILKDIEGLTIEQLNIVPDGFNNNIIWNLGHLVAAQQSVCYRRCGLPMIIEDSYWETYKPGSKPGSFLGADELEKIKGLLFTTIDKMVEDLSKAIFSKYPAWVTRYGVEVAGIDDAIVFLPFHEGLHAAIIGAQKRIITR